MRVSFRRRVAGLTARGLLCLALVPVLVLTAPGVASATTYTASAGWSINLGIRYLGGPKCAGAARWEVTDTSQKIAYSGSCKIAGVESFTGGFDPGSYTELSFIGVRPDGTACGVTGSADVAAGNPGAFSGSATFLGGGLGQDCAIGNVCQYVKVVRDGQWDSDFGDASMSPSDVTSIQESGSCSVLPLGSPDVDSGPSCPYGTPSVTYDTHSGYQHFTITIHSTLDQPQLWNYNWQYTGTGIYPTGSPASINAAAGTDTTVSQATGWGGTLALHGLEVWPSGVLGNAGTDGRGKSTAGTYPPAVYSVNDGVGFWGITDQPHCRFFIGQDGAVRTGVDPTYSNPYTVPNQEPAAPDLVPPDVDSVNDPTTTTCNFDFGDPTTWASGGMCELVGLFGEAVKLLGRILSAVGGIAGDILNGLGDLLTPHPSSWDVAGVRDQFNSRPPGSIIVGGVSALDASVSAYQQPGTCTAIDFTPSSVDGTPGAIDCGGIKSAQGGAAAYAMVELVLWSVTALYVFRIIGSSVEVTS